MMLIAIFLEKDITRIQMTGFVIRAILSVGSALRPTHHLVLNATLTSLISLRKSLPVSRAVLLYTTLIIYEFVSLVTPLVILAMVPVIQIV